MKLVKQDEIYRGCPEYVFQSESDRVQWQVLVNV
jgi:hypothetical protein